MPYEITLPDGSIFPGIPDNISEAQAQERARQMYPDAWASRPEMTRSPVGAGVSGVGSGIAAMRGQLGTAWQALTGAPDEEIRASAERTQAAQGQYAPHPTIHSMRQAYDEAPDLASGLWAAGSQLPAYVTGTIAENAPAMSLPAIGGFIGRTALPLLARGATAVPHPAIKAAGVGLGAALAAFPQFFGGNVEQQAMEAPHNQPIDRGSAALAAAGQAALDPVILAAAGVFGRNEARAVIGSYIQAGARGAGEAAAIGMPSMVTQVIMGRAQAGLPLLNDEALDSYIEAAGSALALTGTMGTYHGVRGEQGARARQTQLEADAAAAREGAQTTADVQRAQDEQIQRNADLVRARNAIPDAAAQDAAEQAAFRARALPDLRQEGGEQRVLTAADRDQPSPWMEPNRQGETEAETRQRMANVANTEVEGPVQVVPDENGYRLMNDRGQKVGPVYDNAETAAAAAAPINERRIAQRTQAEAAKGAAAEPAAILRAAQQATTAPSIKLSDLEPAIQQTIRTQRLREGGAEVDGPVSLTELRERGVPLPIVDAIEARLRPDVAGTQQGMPAFVTRDQRSRLAALGYTPEQIFNMKPEEVHRRLGERQGPPKPAEPLPEGTFTEDQYNAAVKAIQDKGRVDIGLIRNAIGGGPMERARNVREVMASRGVLEKTGEGGNPTYRLPKPVELRAGERAQEAYASDRAYEQAQAEEAAKAQPQARAVEPMMPEPTATRDIAGPGQVTGWRSPEGVQVQRTPGFRGGAEAVMAGGPQPAPLTRVSTFVANLRQQIRDIRQHLKSVPMDAKERPRLERKIADLQKRHDFAIEQAWRKRGTPDPAITAERQMKAEHNAIIDEIHESLKKRLADLGLKPDQVRTFLEHMGDPSKEGLSVNNVITLSLDVAGGIRNPEIVRRIGEVLNHEIIHTLKNLGLIKEREWNALVREAKRTMHPTDKGKTFQESAERRYSEERWTAADREEEAVADMFRYWARDGRLTPRTRTVFQKVVDFFKRVGDVLRGRSYGSAEDVMRGINEGRVGARAEGSAASMRTEGAARPAETRESRAFPEDRPGVKLRPMEDEPPGYFDIMRGDERIGHVKARPSEDGKTVRIDSIMAHDDLGPGATRDLMRQMREHYPDMENIAGTRISGARPEPEYVNVKARYARGIDEAIRERELREGAPPQNSSELIERYARAIKRAPMTAAEEAAWKDTFGPAAQPQSPTRGVGKIVADMASWFRYNYVDQGNAVEKAQRLEANMNRGGVMPRADLSAIAQYNMAKRFQSFFQHMIEHGGVMQIVRDPTKPGSSWVKIGGNHKSLKEMFRPLVNSPAGNLEHQAQMYMAAVRGTYLDAQGRQQPLNPAAIREGLAQGNKHPEIKQFAREYQAFNKDLIDFVKETGAIDAATAHEWTQHGTYYPFYRQIDKEGLPELRGQRRVGGVGAELKIHELKGSPVPPPLAEDMMQAILQNVQYWTKAGLDNMAAAKAAELGRATGIVTDVIPRQASKNGGSFFYRENGKTRQVYTADKQFFGAMRGLELDVVPTWLRWLGFPARLLREMVTRDPAFMLGSNLLRDTNAAFVINKNFRTPVIGTLMGMYDYARGSASSHALLAQGGGGGYDFMASQRATTADKVRRHLTDRAGIHKIGTPSQLMSLLRRAWDATGKVAEASDMSTRIAIYDGTLKRTGSEAQATYEAIMSMPFHRHGASKLGNVLTTLIPFLNARMQGLDVLWHGGMRDTAQLAGTMGIGMSKNQLKNAARFMLRGTMLAGLAFAAKGLAQADPDYAQIDDYIKDGNVLVPARSLGLNERGFFAIPKPFEVGAFFMTIPEHIINYMSGAEDAPHMWRAFLGQASAILGVPTLPGTPVPMPQFLGPVAEISANQSSFTGRPIIPRAEQDLPPQEQYDSRTSAVARLMGNVPVLYDTTTGQWHPVSPRVWDHLLQGYGGTIGGYILGASSYLINNARGDQPPAPAQTLSELPGIRRFFRTPDNTSVRQVSEFYDWLHAATQSQRSVARLTALGDMEGAMREQQQNATLIAQQPGLTQTGHVLTQLRQYENTVRRDATMTPEQKQQALRQIRDMRIMATQNIDQLRAQAIH
jgi:hypothetical protein